MRLFIYYILTVVLSICPGCFLYESIAAGAPTLSLQDYSFGYWKNGWRKNSDDNSKDILCIETGYFGLKLDMDQLDKARFGTFDDSCDYTGALASNGKRMETLASAELAVEVQHDGETYRAITCKSGKDSDVKRLKSTRMWESGKLVQHYDIQGLEFQNKQGQKLGLHGTLDIVAWPDSMTFSAELEPAKHFGANPAPYRTPVMSNAQISISFKNSEHNWMTQKTISGNWLLEQKEQLTLNCELSHQSKKRDQITVDVDLAENQLKPVVFDKKFNSFVARVESPHRSWNGKNDGLRNYDDFDISVSNSGTARNEPFLLQLKRPAQITGLCPILCDENGVPTGIPVQLSKNWHYRQMGIYLRAYALLPVKPGTTKYKLRIIYGFYGSLPSASHAQLSLVGYSGSNARWDQLAIGSWGETYCMDMDMSCVDVAVTDVRMLMARNGLKGKKWDWTDAGWGGDWLNLKDAKGQKHFFNGMKTAYIAHGPCLTEVKYDGFYGAKREVDMAATVRTLRTDDYARTFTTMKYAFDKTVNADGWLFKMGRTHGYVTPKIAYGNEKGLIKEHLVPNSLKPGGDFVAKTTLTGVGPWWVSFPGAYSNRGRNWGNGYRAMVIRSYKAVIGGKLYTNPTVSFPVFNVYKDGKPNLDFLLTAPKGVTQFSKGDLVEFEVEWITLPRVADDYYGPNETFRKHLAENPSSWKTTYREVMGNDLQVKVNGGTVLHKYPLLIKTEKNSVAFSIKGGVGAVPVRFEGLKSVDGYQLFRYQNKKYVKLDQAIHGNDFWQTDYDAATRTYKMTFNLPLDADAQSVWCLKKN